MEFDIEPRIIKLEEQVDKLGASIELSQSVISNLDDRLTMVDDALFGNAKLQREGLIEVIAELQKIVIENQKIIANNPDISLRLSGLNKQINAIKRQLDLEKRSKDVREEESKKLWKRIGYVGLGLGTFFLLIQLIQYLVSISAIQIP